jgi:pimeloyl-ACP methyl ester carboxylesterase
MARLETEDGISLYYEHHLPADAGDGSAAHPPTVVFSCAYCTTHENWRGQVAPLLAAGHPVVLWDLRGHGRSDAPEDDAAYSMERVVSDLHALASATTPERPFVAAGLSFGGLASLHYMKHHPERVAALALFGSGPGFKNEKAAAGWAAQVERTASFLETRGFDDFVSGRAGVTCIGAKPELPAARAAGEAIRGQSVAGVARFGRLVSGPAPSVIDELATMDVPALVMVGEKDEAFLRAAEVMASKLPRARHVVIPDAGHILNIEAASAFDAALLDFLESIAVA